MFNNLASYAENYAKTVDRHRHLAPAEAGVVTTATVCQPTKPTHRDEEKNKAQVSISKAMAEYRHLYMITRPENPGKTSGAGRQKTGAEIKLLLQQSSLPTGAIGYR